MVDRAGAWHVPVVDLHGAFIRRTDFSCAILRGASLSGADCSGALFRNVAFKGARLDGTIFRGADLTGATNLDAGQLATALIDEHTLLPTHIDRTLLSTPMEAS